MAAGSSAPPRTPDFGPLAASYDRLRPVDDNWRELFELLVVEGDLIGRRVLDVGCGTGRVSAALAERGARVWGVDPSEEMLTRARAGARGKVGFKRARAEALPFKDGWFDRAVLRTVVHLLARPQAFRELHRVLLPGGRVAVATFAPEHFESFWLNDFFPSLREIDSRRFPSFEQLAPELRGAGFAEVRTRPLNQRASLPRADAVERIRGRFISTLTLIEDDEFAAGLERAAKDLPATIQYRLAWNVVTAERD